MPQRSIVRKRKKARATKQLAQWREKQEQSEGAASAKKPVKKTEKKAVKKTEKKPEKKSKD